MAFKKVTKTQEADFKRFGTLWESDKYKGLYIQVDDDCDLALFDKKTKKYYKVSKIGVSTPSEKAPKNAVFNLYLNLEDDKHVKFLGSDED